MIRKGLWRRWELHWDGLYPGRVREKGIKGNTRTSPATAPWGGVRPNSGSGISARSLQSIGWPCPPLGPCVSACVHPVQQLGSYPGPGRGPELKVFEARSSASSTPRPSMLPTRPNCSPRPAPSSPAHLEPWVCGPHPPPPQPLPLCSLHLHLEELAALRAHLPVPSWAELHTLQHPGPGSGCGAGWRLSPGPQRPLPSLLSVSPASCKAWSSSPGPLSPSSFLSPNLPQAPLLIFQGRDSDSELFLSASTSLPPGSTDIHMD